MAITGAQAQTFFQARTKGNSFYIQNKDGTVSTCVFDSFVSSNVGLGISVYGISIFPHSADYLVTYLNLDSIGSSNSSIVDISSNSGDLQTT